MGVNGQLHVPAAFTPGKDPVPIAQEAGWAPGPVWMGAENLAPHRDSIPDPPSSVILFINLLLKCASIPTWHLLEASQARYRCVNVNPV